MTDARKLAVALEALQAIADEKRTSLRWRADTGGQRGLEKPNVRAVAIEALNRIAGRVPA